MSPEKRERKSGRVTGDALPRRRRWRVVLLVCLAVIAMTIVMLMTGWPQRTFVEYVVRQALGARLEIQRLSIVGAAARADRIRLYDMAADPAAPPLLEARGVSLSYGELARGPRRFDRLGIDALTIHLDGRDPARTNFAFLTALLNKPKPERARDLTGYMPSAVTVKSMSILAEFPDMQAAVAGFEVAAAVRGTRDLDLQAHGSKVTGEWRVASQSAAGVFDDGHIDVAVVRKGGSYRTSRIDVVLPGFFEMVGAASMTEQYADSPARIEADVERFALEGADLSGARWSFLPLPLKFGHVEVANSRIRMTRGPDGISVSDAGIEASAQDVALGLDGREWFTGDFRLVGRSDGREHGLDVTFGDGQALKFEASGTIDNARIRATTDTWTRDQVAQLLPRALPPILDQAPELRAISAAADVYWRRPDYTLALNVTPTFNDDAAGGVEAKGQGTLLADGPTFAGNAKATWADGAINSTLEIQSRDNFTVAAKLAEVDLRKWMVLVPSLPLADAFRGIASGSIDVKAANALEAEANLNLKGLGVDRHLEAKVKATATAPSLRPLRPMSAKGAASFPRAGGTADFAVALPEGNGYTVESHLDKLDVAAAFGLISTSAFFDASGSKLSGRITLESAGEQSRGAADLTADPSPLPQFFVPAERPVRMQTKWTAPPGLAEFKGSEMRFDLGDDLIMTLADWSLKRKDVVFAGKLSGRVPVSRLAPFRNMPELSGMVGVTAPVEYKDGSVRATFALEGEELGYGAYVAPPGAPIAASGILDYEIAKRKGRVEKPVISWTDSTRIDLENMNFTTAPALAPTSFKLVSDLAPLVNWGLVEKAEGSATVAGTVRYADHVTAFDAAFNAIAPTLVLQKKLAVLGGVAFDGRLGHADGISVEGRVGAATMTAAGAVLHEVRGPLVYKAGKLTSNGLTATVWGGRLAADIEADLGEPTRPIKVQAGVEKLDLAAFTREYKPPRTNLTGLGDGTVKFTWSKEGFSVLDADLQSSEGFSVNRDLVYQLLMSQYVKEAKGGKKFDQIVGEVLGKADQRSFDSGRIVLGMGEGERIEGDAVLKSKALNLTIDIKMDPEALAQLLELRQEANLDENIAGIRTEPIELRDQAAP